MQFCVKFCQTYERGAPGRGDTGASRTARANEAVLGRRRDALRQVDDARMRPLDFAGLVCRYSVRRAALFETSRLSDRWRVRASLLLDAYRQLEDVAASRHRERDGEEPVGDNCEVVGGRPTSRACVRV